MFLHQLCKQANKTQLENKYNCINILGLVGEDRAKPDEMETKKMQGIFSQEIQVYKAEIQELRQMVKELKAAHT